jgi:hypothetical protein
MLMKNRNLSLYFGDMPGQIGFQESLVGNGMGKLWNASRAFCFFTPLPSPATRLLLRHYLKIWPDICISKVMKFGS